MRLKRIMIAAPKSGSGKTTITCLLLEALKSKGLKVASYKCGPDYIDPMFHEKVIGIPSKNLDTFFTGEEKTTELFMKDRTGNDFAVLEGVMGLFDGLGGVREEGSSYHLARVTKAPIVLLIDAKGMGRSVIPEICGFLKYDEEHLIKGVILNRMSKSYFEIVKPLIEQELHTAVLGYFPENKDLHIESRHLGLVMPNELADIKEQLKEFSVEFAKTVSVEKIMEIAEAADELEETYLQEAVSQEDSLQEAALWQGNVQKNSRKILVDIKSKPVIAVARDEAFCFYYKDNLLMLKENGAEIKYFSPLHDKKLPDDCNALLLGGGYPELYAAELSSNISMRGEVRRAFNNGMPVVAECGGFMYLHSEIIDKNGISYEMAGAIQAVCSYKGKLVRFGYIEVKEKESCFLLEGERIRGHEFHYFDSTDNGDSCIAIKPVTGKEYSCVMEGENYWLGFPHLYYPSNPSFVRAFVKKAEEYRKNQ